MVRYTNNFMSFTTREETQIAKKIQLTSQDFAVPSIVLVVRALVHQTSKAGEDRGLQVGSMDSHRLGHTADSPTLPNQLARNP